MYVECAYYHEIYGGNMPEQSFRRNERKAESYIRSLTYMHGDIFAEDSDAIRDAVCAVADVYYKIYESQTTQSVNGPVKSENNDGYSVSYVTEQTDGQTVDELVRKKAYAAAYQYLLPTGWLSRKAGCVHDD